MRLAWALQTMINFRGRNMACLLDLEKLLKHLHTCRLTIEVEALPLYYRLCISMTHTILWPGLICLIVTEHCSDSFPALQQRYSFTQFLSNGTLFCGSFVPNVNGSHHKYQNLIICVPWNSLSQCTYDSTTFI